MRDITEELKRAETTDFPEFYTYRTPLERGLWILWVGKEKLGTKRLTAEEIASVIRDAMEISIDAKSITNAFNRAGDKIHTYRENNAVYFEIMKPGKDYLLSQVKGGSVELLYFEPDRRFSSKRILAKNILGNLKGELKIVDPYCNERTLDILKDVRDRKVKFLTMLGNLSDRGRKRFLREIEDFKSENENIEFRSYPHADIHDRYVISAESLVILGHSIKDLGSKESFGIVLDKISSKNVAEALNENFDRRWKQSETI